MSRLEDLQTLRDGLLARMADCESDQNYAVMGRLLVDVVKQIDEVAGAGSGESGAPRGSGLSEFEQRLRERESGPAGSRQAAR